MESQLDNQGLVYEYFNRIDKQDLTGLADMFDYDARLYEPFSNMKDGLKGREQIVYFLKVALMANKGLKRKISFGAASKNSIEANVVYERGDKVKSKLFFEFTDESKKKIKLLRIQFS